MSTSAVFTPTSISVAPRRTALTTNQIGMMLVVARSAKDIALMQLSLAPLIGPRPHTVRQLSSGVAVMHFKRFRRTTFSAGLPGEIVGTSTRHPFTLILTLRCFIAIWHIARAGLEPATSGL